MDQLDQSIDQYTRAVNYLAAAQIYLKDNVLLEEPLQPEHIKPRLLGHWGTCPGINYVYAHLQWLINKNSANALFLLGPGHGFAALQANLFIESSLNRRFPEATHTASGVEYIVRSFSWPHGFPSHSSPLTPGVIVEGGELGYALATAYGAVLDNPDLIAVCLIGDGEAETGPTATAWHLNKFNDPATNGAVLPILHLNGYKISGPTIFGRMSDQELTNLFSGYGYTPAIVDGLQGSEPMRQALTSSYQQIKDIQEQARQGNQPAIAPKFPMIILKTPKGWGGIEELDGQRIIDNHLSHQVVVKDARTDPQQLAALESWLQSYQFNELFSKTAGFNEEILSLLPDEELRMGNSTHAHGGPPHYEPLHLPPPAKYALQLETPGSKQASSMITAGNFLAEVFQVNSEEANFRFFSPDETYSNKLDAIFQQTSRAFVWPSQPWDQDMSPNGRVMEMLSEHSLQGLIQGYVLTGRHGIFASYEAFIQIVASMADQYAKFLSVAREIDWRGDIPSLNYILTSSGWRQDHNGFSHQNPGFIDDMLQRQGCFVNIYLPPDANSTLAVLEKCLHSKNEINIIVAGKTDEPQWLTLAEAERSLQRGLMTWQFASDDDPHVILAAAGDYLTKEVLSAISIVKQDIPDARLRYVSIISLSALGLGGVDCQVPLRDFDDYFTADKPVIINFHGYPQTIKQILFDYAKKPERFSVHGYNEVGSTTTPFDMHVRNGTDRYQLAGEIVSLLADQQVIPTATNEQLNNAYRAKLGEHHQYIKEHGEDHPDIATWQWQSTSS